MNETITTWQLMVLTIQSLPIQFWRVVLTVIGAAFSLGDDTHTLFLKGRAIFYGTVFGYLIADAIISGFELSGYANLLFALFGIGGNWIAGIVQDAFQEAKANWRTIVPFVWNEIKDSLPIKSVFETILTRLKTPKK